MSVPDAIPDVSVVAPVYRNRDTLIELHHRVGAVLDRAGKSWELVLVDDCGPDESRSEIDRLAGLDPRVVAVQRERRGGQHRALVTGIAASRGAAVVTLDADLQDPPEALPLLLDRLIEAPVVYAGRRGTYQSAYRHATSRVFKWAIGLVAGMPSDAGAFLALDRPAADAIARFRTRTPFVPAMAALLGRGCTSVGVERSPRARGTSAYSSGRRLGAGVSALSHAIVWRFAGTGLAAARVGSQAAEHPAHP